MVTVVYNNETWLAKNIWFSKISIKNYKNETFAWIHTNLIINGYVIFSKVFQKRALVVKRGSYKDKQVNYLANFFTTQHFVEMLQKVKLTFTFIY